MTRLMPIRDMPTRDPSLRLPFSQGDIKYMIEWLVENAADGTTRTGNKLWQGLMNDPLATAWASRHTWQSWRKRYLDRQAQYDLMINSELKKRRAPTVASPLPFTQQDAKRLAWYFRTEEIPEENRSDISVYKRLIEENKWKWCARHGDIEWQLLYSVKGETIDALAASDEPLDYAIPTPTKGDTAANGLLSSSKRPRLSEVTLLENETDEPKTKKRRFNEASAFASKTPNATVDGNDPILIPFLAQLQANGDAPIVEQSRSGAELVAEAQTTEERETLERRDTLLAGGEITDVSVVPESVHEASPLLPVRSPSIQLVASSKLPKRKWRAKAFNSLQTAAEDDYFETGPSSPNTHGAVVGAETDTASQRRARHEGAEDVESLDLEFEEVELGKTVVETFEQDINTTDHPDEVPSNDGLQALSSPAEETSTTAANGILPNTSDNGYQHVMPQYPEVPDVFSNPPVENSTRTAVRSWLATHPKGQKNSQLVKKGLTSGQLDQRDSPAARNTLFFERTSGTRDSVDGHSQSLLPSSSAPHSPISSISTNTPTDANAPPHFKAAKRNGEGNLLKSVSGPLSRARAPPRVVPIQVRDSSLVRRSSPSQLRKEPPAERRRTFGGWPTTLATSSIRKGEAKTSNPRRKRRDSTPALPATMTYRDQQEDADWLRTVEKKIKVIPRYSDPRKRRIPSLPPETSSDDTNTVNRSEDEDDLEEKVCKMSTLDIERVMNVLNIAPRNKVLKQWKRQNRSDAWIIWNGLVFVLEELASRFNTGVAAAREAWAAAGDLVVTEKALSHAQETARNTVSDVIRSEAEEASRRRMEIWAPSRQTPERWGGTSKRNSRHYERGGGPPTFVPAEAVQVAVEAATSPWYNHELKRGSSKVLREAFEELPMLSFDGVGPGGVTILRE